MELLKLKIIGTSPLMMHSDRLANPLLPETKAHKELTGKRKKTDDDHLAIAKSEFISGAYWDAKIGFYIPGQNLDATFWGGAKLQKMGVHWRRGALVMEDRIKLIHSGAATPEKLWIDPAYVDCRGVRIGASKLMRYRPVFLNWSAELSIALNTDVLDVGEAKKAIEDGGKLIGTCEFRPRYGRFEVTYG
ncbi:MAG: hypothetical protein JWR21_865 [Herminiimonas sp.]|nr:hypothetical protein [Herminiimonas sp.]